MKYAVKFKKTGDVVVTAKGQFGKKTVYGYGTYVADEKAAVPIIGGIMDAYDDFQRKVGSGKTYADKLAGSAE